MELKLSLARGAKELRERLWLRQMALAEKLGLRQSRVAKMEAGDRSVSLDLTMRCVLSIGATTTEKPEWIRRAEGRHAAWKHFKWSTCPRRNFDKSGNFRSADSSPLI